MNRRTLLLPTGLIFLALLVPSVRAVEGLSVAEFEKLHQDLCACTEPWQSIPWQLSILEARAKAAQEGKPVYMLVRSGHPLGCV